MIFFDQLLCYCILYTMLAVNYNGSAYIFQYNGQGELLCFIVTYF